MVRARRFKQAIPSWSPFHRVCSFPIIRTTQWQIPAIVAGAWNIHTSQCRSTTAPSSASLRVTPLKRSQSLRAVMKHAEDGHRSILQRTPLRRRRGPRRHLRTSSLEPPRNTVSLGGPSVFQKAEPVDSQRSGQVEAFFNSLLLPVKTLNTGREGGWGRRGIASWLPLCASRDDLHIIWATGHLLAQAPSARGKAAMTRLTTEPRHPLIEASCPSPPFESRRTE